MSRSAIRCSAVPTGFAVAALLGALVACGAGCLSSGGDAPTPEGQITAAASPETTSALGVVQWRGKVEDSGAVDTEGYDGKGRKVLAYQYSPGDGVMLRRWQDQDGQLVLSSWFHAGPTGEIVDASEDGQSVASVVGQRALGDLIAHGNRMSSADPQAGRADTGLDCVRFQDILFGAALAPATYLTCSYCFAKAAAHASAAAAAHAGAGGGTAAFAAAAGVTAGAPVAVPAFSAVVGAIFFAVGLQCLPCMTAVALDVAEFFKLGVCWWKHSATDRCLRTDTCHRPSSSGGDDAPGADSAAPAGDDSAGASPPSGAAESDPAQIVTPTARP
jgi:hypothetical protein